MTTVTIYSNKKVPLDFRQEKLDGKVLKVKKTVPS